MSELSSEEQHTCERLLDKSQEAFVLAIELFNRPTIKYRVEGCAFFLCNAWELMLKAYLIKQNGYRSIFYPGKEQRTLSLEDCVKKVMTNDKDPVRANIESITELRNTGTHFIVEEYEITYGPIFQANIRDYDERIRAYHAIEICDRIPDNYLVLSVNRNDIDRDSLRAKYTPEVAERLLGMQSDIFSRAEEDTNGKYSGYYFYTEFRLSKKEGIPLKITKDANTGARVIKQLIDPADKYPYRRKDVLNEVNRKMMRNRVRLVYKDDADARLNGYHFELFTKCYGMKGDERYSYDRSSRVEKKGKQHAYLYSNAAIDLIYEEIRKDPGHIIENLLKKINAHD